MWLVTSDLEQIFQTYLSQQWVTQGQDYKQHQHQQKWIEAAKPKGVNV